MEIEKINVYSLELLEEKSKDSFLNSIFQNIRGNKINNSDITEGLIDWGFSLERYLYKLELIYETKEDAETSEKEFKMFDILSNGIKEKTIPVSSFMAMKNFQKKREIPKIKFEEPIQTGREFDSSFEDDFIVKESNDFIATIEKDINSKMEEGVFECAKEIGFVMNKQKIIETLEKGMAMKPADDEEVGCVCPSCEYFVHAYGNYCCNCGQKLDWSIEEEDERSEDDE